MFHGQTVSKQLAAAPFALFHALEYKYRKHGFGQARIFQDFNYLPLIDLYQWPEKAFDASTLPEVLSLSRTYLRAASPLVTVTWGSQVSLCAMNSFVVGGDPSSTNFLNEVGTWRIVEYADPDFPLILRRHCCTIAVACYDPSAASDGVLDVAAFTDLYHLTLTVA